METEDQVKRRVNKIENYLFIFLNIIHVLKTKFIQKLNK